MRKLVLNIIHNYILPIRPYVVSFGDMVILGPTAAWEYDELRLGIALVVFEVGITIPLPVPKKGT